MQDLAHKSTPLPTSQGTMHRPLSEHLVPTTIPCTRLPLELIEILISLAYDDEDSHTLVACTLVSRLWRWASRRSLFRKVTISSGVRLAQLEALLALDHSLASLIHCLVIRPDPLARLCPASSAWLVRLPDRLPSLLHNLEALHLVGIHHSADVPSWGGGSHRIRDHAVGTALSTFARFDAFTTVHTLVLRGCTLEPTCLYVLAGALPSLRRLAVSYLQVPQRSAPPPSPHHTHTAAATPRRPRLTALELDVGHIFSLATQSVLAWAAATPSCHSLRTAVLTVRTSDAEAAGRFLAAVGPRLHALDLRFEAYFGLPLETASACPLASILLRWDAHWIAPGRYEAAHVPGVLHKSADARTLRPDDHLARDLRRPRRGPCACPAPHRAPSPVQEPRRRVRAPPRPLAARRAAE